MLQTLDPQNEYICKHMDIEYFREYCLSKKGTTESFPFGGDTLVFKVMGKMFALTGVDNLTLSINLKCDPEYALELRANYEAITGGYHMNKKYWNSVDCAHPQLKDDLIRKMIDHSYEMVVAGLTKKQKQELEQC